MRETRTYYLLKQYYNDLLTHPEWVELDLLLNEADQNQVEQTLIQLMKDLTEETDIPTIQSEQFKQSLKEILEIDQINQQLGLLEENNHRPKNNRFKWYSIAAALILCTLLPIYYFFNNETPNNIAVNEEVIPQDIQPGKDGGVLTLNDGTTLVLDELPEGQSSVKEIGHVQIKINRTDATYSITQEVPSPSIVYQQIETPKGRKYKVNLSDGTSIWLNAGSKLRYPLQFGEEERVVYLSGEAYFEVAHNEKKPFKVKFDNSSSQVEVLGTRFNVSNYPGSKGISTSLIDGKVNIKTEGSNKVLKPGQIAFAAHTGNIQVNNLEDPLAKIAWKDNFFYFQETDIKTLMEELGRWYDFEVEYQGSIPTTTYSGKIGKDLTFSQVLEILGGTNLEYERVTKNRIIIK